ncbi:unnamed protein product [Timema podura]|uniref:Uncharacterized protein n=1 Tax=Timema podura TaxID=61482 RepID=A0ABN7NJB1_TIMPD|nr:unnamed protein product [Timema podura]
MKSREYWDTNFEDRYKIRKTKWPDLPLKHPSVGFLNTPWSYSQGRRAIAPLMDLEPNLHGTTPPTTATPWLHGQDELAPSMCNAQRYVGRL